MGTDQTIVGEYLEHALGDAQRLEFTDELTIYGAAEAHRRVLAALAAGGPLELDLGEVGELDSAGVQLLLALERECAAQARELRVTAISPAAREVLTLLNLPRFAALADAA